MNRSSRQIPPRSALLALTATLLGALALAAPAGAKPPNVIVVMTDDQSVAELSRETMPATLNALKRRGRGTSFDNSIVSTPICCPSRAGYITGQYPHNNGVFNNEPGYPALERKSTHLYGWLQAAGYRTGHLGRWLLNYDAPAPLGELYDTRGGLEPPAGIEHWFGYVGSATHYYGAQFSRNGEPVQLGTGPASYTTSAINREALDFVAAAEGDPRPFFLTVAHLAPHSSPDRGKGQCGVGGLPYPRGGKVGPFADDPLPRPRSFDEKRIADKPHWVRSIPPVGPDRRRLLERGWRCAQASLGTVDDGLRSLVRRLDRQGELDNTAIFFTSDNGYLFGEHRVFLNKVYPYEESIRVPLLASVPERKLGRRVRRTGRPRRIGAPVNNLDLTATILDLARAAPCTAAGECRTLDGRSLMPLLRGKRPEWSRGRALLVQFGSYRECGVPPPEGGLPNFYDAVRTRGEIYVEHNRVAPDTGACDRPEFELYDLGEDPLQLDNAATNPLTGSPSRRQAGLASRLNKLRACSGIAGRDPGTSAPFCE